MFLNKQTYKDNNDLQGFMDLDYYLDLTKDFKSSFGDFNVKQVDGFNVIELLKELFKLTKAQEIFLYQSL